MSQHKKERRIVEQVERTGTKEFVQFLDVDTGEVIDAFWRERREKPSGRPHGGRSTQFFRVYRENWRDLVQRSRLTMYEVGFLFSMMAFLQWNGPYLVDHATGKNLSESDLADLFKIDRKQVHATLEALNQKGVVSLVKRGTGRPSHIMLNSHVVYFGKHMQNLADHAVFDDVAWQPVKPITYKERG